VFATCRWIFRGALKRPDLAWLGNYSRMMEATTVGFMIGAFFLNRGHFDLIYHWLALVSALAAVAWVALAASPDKVAARRGGVQVRWRPAVPATAGGRWGRRS